MPLKKKTTVTVQGGRVIARKERMKITKTVAVKPLKDQTKAAVMSLMKRMIHQNQENKEVGWRIQANIAHNSGITNADLVPIVPQIGPGTDGSTRIGDKVKPLRLTVKGIVSVDENPDTRPFYVRVLMLSQKDVKVGSRVGTDTDPAHLLRTAIPGASEIAFSGNREELDYYVNDNKFKVYYDKQFLITPASAASGNPLKGSQFKFSKTFKSLPSHFTFDEGNGTWVNNFAPFFAIGYAYADGGAPDTVATRINCEAYARLTYEDA